MKENVGIINTEKAHNYLCRVIHITLRKYSYKSIKSGYFNFVAKVPSQSSSCAFLVLISLHFLFIIRVGCSFFIYRTVYSSNGYIKKLPLKGHSLLYAMCDII